MIRSCPVQTAMIPSFPEHRATDDGRIQRLEPRGWRTLPQSVNPVSGYVTVSIENQSRYVHRLVLEAFVGPCPIGLEARHFPDFDKANNRPENLSWATHQVNLNDIQRVGSNRGLTEQEVIGVIMLRKWKVKEIADFIGCSLETVRKILRGEIYKDIIRARFLNCSSQLVRKWFINGI